MQEVKIMKKLLLLGLVLALLPAANLEAKTSKKIAGKNSQGTFELNVAHINDHHSHLEEEKMPIKLDGKTVTVHIGGLPRVGQEIKNFRKNNKNTLVVHAGDAVTGTLYYTLFEGKADAELMNAINFDAYTLGNHEFDDGNKFLRSFLDALKIPVVSSNVVPDKGSILEGKWKPYIIKNIGGQNVGIIGIDVVKKTKESSSPGEDIKFLDEVETARKYAKELQDKGINKIVLLSHAGYEKNVEIGQKVDGIDLIISGDTHYLLGKEFEQFGLVPEADSYPKKVTSPNGNPVYIAEAWNYSYLLGEMKAKFDKNGVITELTPAPKLLIGDDFFEVKDADGKAVQLDEKEKSKILNSIKNNKNIVAIKNDPALAKLLERYQKEKTELGKRTIGKITEEIPGGSDNRVPSEHNKDGSFATTLVAESVLHKLRNTGTGNVDFVLGARNVSKITKAVNTPKFISTDINHDESEYAFGEFRGSPYKSHINISIGCDKKCTYCIVPHTRGDEISIPSSLILKEVEKAAKSGAKEIFLLGQNVNNYGKRFSGVQENIDFSDLLVKISEIEGLERIRFTSPHPLHMDDKFLEIFSSSLCSHTSSPE